MKQRRLRSLMRYLRQLLPFRLPVRLRLTSRISIQFWGDCDLRGHAFHIRVSDHLTEEAAVGVLLHEAAHALSWGLDGDEDHGEFFKVARTTVFNAYLDWLRKEQE